LLQGSQEEGVAGIRKIPGFASRERPVELARELRTVLKDINFRKVMEEDTLALRMVLRAMVTPLYRFAWRASFEA